MGKKSRPGDADVTGKTKTRDAQGLLQKILKISRLKFDVEHGGISDFIETSDEGVSSIFALVAKMTEDEAFQHVKGILIAKGYKVVSDDKFYLFAEGNIPIIVNAHVDTVFRNPPSRLLVTDNTGLVFTTDDNIGIGADDRSGVSIIIELINRGLRPHVVITKMEERGDQGARELVSKFKQNPLETRYIIGLDRRGQNDAVFYYMPNRDFKTYITKNFGFKEDSGTTSDIAVLCRAWNVAGVNLSTGYYNPHSPEEVQSLAILEDITGRVAGMLGNVPPERFGYVSKGEEAAYAKHLEEERARDEEYRVRRARDDERYMAERKVLSDFARNPSSVKLYDEARANFATRAMRIDVFEKEAMKNKKPTRASLENRGYSDKRIRRFNDLIDRISWNVPYCVFNFSKMIFYHVNKEGKIVEHKLSFDEMDKLGIFTMLKIDERVFLDDDVKELESLVASPPDATRTQEKACEQEKVPRALGGSDRVSTGTVQMSKEQEMFKMLVERDYDYAARKFNKAISRFATESLSNRILALNKMRNKRHEHEDLLKKGFSNAKMKRYDELTQMVADYVTWCAFDFSKDIFYYVSKEGNLVEREFSYKVFDELDIFFILKWQGIFLEDVVKELDRISIDYKTMGTIEKNASLKDVKVEQDAGYKFDIVVPSKIGMYKNRFMPDKKLKQLGFTKAEIKRFDECSAIISNNVPWFSFNFAEMMFMYRYKGKDIVDGLNLYNLSKTKVLDYIDENVSGSVSIDVRMCVNDIYTMMVEHKART